MVDFNRLLELERAGHTEHCRSRIMYGDGTCECGAELCAGDNVTPEDRFAVFKLVLKGHNTDCAKDQAYAGAACVCGWEPAPMFCPPWLEPWYVMSTDVETTHLSPLRGRVVQLGGSLFLSGRLVRRASILVDPECAIPPETTAVHGLTDDHVKGAPTFPRAMEMLREQLAPPDDGVLYVAHNMDFDRAFLVAEHLRGRMDGKWLFDNDRWLCTMVMAKALKHARKYDRGYRLAELCQACKIDLDWKLHDAGDDAEAAGRLLYAMSRWLPKTLEECLAGQANWLARNS